MRGDLGRAIQNELERVGWSRAELRRQLAARDVKVSATSISAWCHGQRNPEPRTLLGILDALAIQGAARLRLYDLAHQARSK